MSGRLLVLGPQRPEPNLADALKHAEIDGPVALISAGWRHDEGETRAILAELDRPMHHFTLYQWFEEICREEPGLSRAYSARQDQVKAFKRANRVRLYAALSAVDTLLERRSRDPEVYERVLFEAIEDVRRIDRRVEEEVERIRADFPEVARPWEYPRVRARHEEMKTILNDVSAVLVAGGHVGVLRNRMLFFGLEALLPTAVEEGASIVAWSAGAMALSDRIVLFYDDPPDGNGGAEVHGTGLGILPDHLFFPHARRRLRLGDQDRITCLVRRFTPHRCLAIEAGAWLDLTDGLVNRGERSSCREFQDDGSLVEVKVAS